MDVRDFDYDLPSDRIAQFPMRERDASRLLVLQRDTGNISHSRFQDLSTWLDEGDLLVVNDTRVIPARLRCRKTSGGRIEILLYESLSPEGCTLPPTEAAGAFRSTTWRCLVRGGGKVRDGTEVILPNQERGILRRPSDGTWCVHFPDGTDIRDLLEQCGEIPLPPYIRRQTTPLDRHRYQTLFGHCEGSIAAPTAGLHFTESALQRLRDQHVGIGAVTLQVGIGTFVPVRCRRISEHRMHPEYMVVGDALCGAWHRTRGAGGRVIAVGTTTVRALETAADADGGLQPYEGFTSLFIYPGHRFKSIDGMITNFHLPRSSLLMLVAAFAGRETVMKVYREAIVHGYRFYSYGDAMLIQ
jgi:S-adenosylmethionine:tRNA ribosyltransferase-isomerase